VFFPDTRSDEHESVDRSSGGGVRPFRSANDRDDVGGLMSKFKLEYIWLDGYEPVPNLRSKTTVKEFAGFPSLEELPVWGFDGSSTRQAEGGDSDRLLKPVASFPDPARVDGLLVMCEVLMPDETPHPSNSRATIPDDPDTWFGFEQEYFLYRDGRPLGFPTEGFPSPQGEYYTGVGYKNVGDIAREIVDTHLDYCLAAGINHEGINAEVAKGQWEFQIFGKGSKRAADEVWVARYLLLRLCEKYRVDVNFHPKPLGADFDWNGSGMHTNFSTKYLREVGGKAYFEALMAAFDEYKGDHIAVYGPDNHMRLTGLHETQAIDKFNYGVANRGASIRVPHSFMKDDYRGYLEDRRPNSLGDPYQIAGRILMTIQTVPTGETPAREAEPAGAAV
jgi:glutamine synthetase